MKVTQRRKFLWGTERVGFLNWIGVYFWMSRKNHSKTDLAEETNDKKTKIIEETEISKLN